MSVRKQSASDSLRIRESLFQCQLNSPRLASGLEQHISNMTVIKPTENTAQSNLYNDDYCADNYIYVAEVTKAD